MNDLRKKIIKAAIPIFQKGIYQWFRNLGKESYLLLFSLIIFLLFSTSLIAQTSNSDAFTQDSLLAIEYYNIADTAYNNVDKCLRYNHLAISLLKKTGQMKKYVYCLAALSYCYDKKEYYDSMEMNNILAIKEAEKYLAPNDRVFIAVINNLGVVDSRIKQDHSKALQLYKDALSRITNNEKHRDLGVKGTLLNNIGKEYRLIGDFDQAIIYHKEALRSYQQANEQYLNDNNNIDFKFADVYIALAELYEFQKKYALAIQYIQEELKLLNLHRKIYDKSYFIYAYVRLAKLSIKQNELDTADGFLKKAITFDTLTNKQKASISSTYAILNFRKGAYQEASIYIDKALKNIPDQQALEKAKAIQLRAQIYNAQKKYALAIAASNEAIAHLVPEFNPGSLSTLTESTKVLSRIELLYILNIKAKVLQAYYEEEPQTALLEEALEVYQSISSLSDLIRQNYQSEESKIFLNETTFYFYEDALSLIYRLYQITGNEAYIDQAFFFSEKSKSMALLDELLSKNAENVFSIPEAVKEDFYQLRSEINFYNKLLNGSQQKDSVKAQEWNSQLLKARRAYTEINDNLKKEHSNYYQLTRPQIISVSELQKEILIPQQAFIEYFIGTEKAYVFIITKKEARFYELLITKDFLDQIKKLLNDLKLSDRENAFANASRFLYKKLIEPLAIPKDITHLLIVPDAQLAYLPFELLLSKPPEGFNPKRWPFLIRDYYFAYAYSATVLLNQKKAIIKPAKVLAIVPVFENQATRHLQHSEKELDAFETIVNKVLLKEAANKNNFISEWTKYEVLHISSHASASDSLLHQPCIDFWDEQLFLSDLYTLNAHPQLVVLSACESGIGDFHRGENVLSLARGFTYAGASSIVTTLWKVNDKATAEIMKSFYHFLEKGRNKDEALRAAKLAYLETCADYRSTPYYWASFLQLGDSRALSFQKKKSTSLWFYILSFSVLCIALLYFFFRKKND